MTDHNEGESQVKFVSSRDCLGIRLTAINKVDRALAPLEPLVWLRKHLQRETETSEYQTGVNSMQRNFENTE